MKDKIRKITISVIIVFFFIILIPILFVCFYTLYLVETVKTDVNADLLSFVSNSSYLEEYYNGAFKIIPKYVDGSVAVESDIWNYYLSHQDEYECYEITFVVNNTSSVNIPMYKVTIENDFNVDMIIAQEFSVGIPVVNENQTVDFILRVLVNTSKCSLEDIEKMKKELVITIQYEYLTKDLATFGIDEVYYLNHSGKIVCKNKL